MSLVADASVLIFLGKIRQLHWIQSLFQKPFYLPQLVKNEVFFKGLPPSEEEYLTQELNRWETVSWIPRVARLAGGLCASDIAVLEIAKQKNADWVLADEKALRQVLASRRHKVVGTLGVLLMARRGKLISSLEAQQAADELIASHRFRTSADTYRFFLKRLSYF